MGPRRDLASSGPHRALEARRRGALNNSLRWLDLEGALHEFYRRTHFQTRQELARKLREWEWEYNHRRLHLGLGGKTPAERLAELRITRPSAVGKTA